MRNKRALVGLGIILFFVFIALAAPLLTPYTILGEDQTRTGAIAGRYVAPIWLAYFPTWLGGNPRLSQNMQPLNDPSQPKPWPEGQWNLTVNPLSTESAVSTQFSPTVNYPYVVEGYEFPNENGSLAVTFNRPQGSLLNNVSAYVYTDFQYPYSGPPETLTANFELLVNGTYTEKIAPENQWYFIQILPTPSGLNKPKLSQGPLDITTSSSSGLYLAATTDINQYFKNEDTLAPLGYATWEDWLNGTTTALPNGSIVTVPEGVNITLRSATATTLPNGSAITLPSATATTLPNGTAITVPEGVNITLPSATATTLPNGVNITLPANWNQTQWVATEGSQTNQTSFDITQIKDWTAPSATLTNASSAGDTRIYVNSTNNFTVGATFTLGSNQTQEVCQAQGIGATYINLTSPLLYNHDMNEILSLTAKTVRLYDYLTVTGDEAQPNGYYVLLRVTIKNPVDVFQLQLSGIQISLAKDQNLQFVPGFNNWQVYRRSVSLDVPIKVKVFLAPESESLDNLATDQLHTLFPIGVNVPAGFNVNGTNIEINKPYFVRGNELAEDKSVLGSDWIISKDSQPDPVGIIYNEIPAQLLSMFTPAPGLYRFGMEITFLDSNTKNANVSTTVYIDDFTPKLYGTSFGLLGSDEFGRDLYTQLIYGTRISLYIGILVAVVSVVIGLAVGLLAGYWGGAADQFLMRFNDLLLVLPSLPLMVVLVAVLGTSINTLIVLLALLGWNGFARLVRSQVISLKERPFVEAAKASGAGTGHIVTRHILPHVMALVYISLATAVPGAITTEAALSFLGFYDPTRMSWGRMLHDVFAAGATQNWWWIIPPGLCIAAIATAFILLGFALDEILNPKLRQRR